NVIKKYGWGISTNFLLIEKNSSLKSIVEMKNVLEKVVKKSASNKKSWRKAILDARKHTRLMIKSMNHVWQQGFSLERLFLTSPWLFAKEMRTLVSDTIFSKAAMWLLIGVFIGMCLTFTTVVIIFCSGRPGRGNLMELKFTGNIQNMKKRKKRISS